MSEAVKKQPQPSAGAEFERSVLLVSPLPEDHLSLRQVLNLSQWRLHHTRTYRDAIRLVCRVCVPVVVCEHDLPDGDWKDVLSILAELPDPPLLVVTSLHADGRFWSEVLNLGAHDVLPKPFREDEVGHILGFACLKWQQEREGTRMNSRVQKAASA